MNMSALRIEGLRVRLGTAEVLKGIDLEIRNGEFVVLVGPSGCGKSTLLNVIAGLEKASSGRVLIGGRDVTGVAPKDRDIAMVFQSYALYPGMTVRGNITFGMQCRGVPKAEQHAAVERVAKLLQIGQLLERKPSELSGGQRQRVAMGRALVRDPVLFLFDEPLSNLDAKLRVEMRMEIKRLHQRLGTTIVYVTHDQIEAMTLATRIAVMRGGEILQFDDPQNVYDKPENLFVAGFMGSPPMNFIPVRLEADEGRLIAVAGGTTMDRPRVARMALPQSVDQCEGLLGKPAMLGVRPECIVLGGDAPVKFTAQVEMIEPTGAETLAILTFAGTEIVARMDAESRPAVGTCAEFSFDLRKSCLFDSATQRRVA
jgi:multiple sugar transport system ATP-binding protein